MRSLSPIGVCVLLTASAAAAQDSPHQTLQALNALRVEPSRVYFVRDFHFRRDAARLELEEGKLAFLQAYQGRLTGAVFVGTGRVLVMPRDAAERQSLARYVGTPLLDQSFSRAYFRFTDDTGESLLRQLADEGVRPERDPGFAASWDSMMSDLNPSQSIRVMADLLSQNPRPYFYAGLMGDASGPFDVLVDYRRDEAVNLGQTRWAGGRRFYDVWASFPSANVTEPPPDLLQPEFFDIDTSILADNTLEGRTDLRVKVVTGGERVVALELSRHLRVSEVTDGAGQPVPFFQSEDLSGAGGAQRGNDSIFLVMPQPLHEGDVITFRLAYRGSVIADAGNGVFFVGDRGSWYPHLAGSDRFAKFTLTFRWPAKLRLVATGLKVEEGEEGEWRFGRWKSEGPIPVAGFNLGDYALEVTDSTRPQIELYANRVLEQALASRFRTRTIPPPVIVRTLPENPPRPGTPPRSIPLILPDAPPPSPAAQLKELGREFTEAIRFFEKTLGPFPYGHLAITQIPGSFGQGWPGLLYLSTFSFLEPAVQGRAGIARRSQEQFTELLPFHELAHQWWGNLVSWPTYRDQWIHEGLANYMALLFAESRKGQEKQLNVWLERFRDDLVAKVPDSDDVVDDIGPLTHGYRLHSSKSLDAYSSIVYGKGAWVFHMIRMLLQDPSAKDPDARFHKLLQTLLNDYRYSSISTDDLQREIEKVMTPAMALEGGRKFDWFFDEWVRGTGIPHYSVSVEIQQQGKSDSYVIRGKLKQSEVPESFIAPVPLYATRSSGKPVLLGTVVTTGNETPFQFTVRFRPGKIQIDPDLTLLCIPE
jgi:hypothetical protein